MRVLIIGGTGLISTAITRALVTRGDDVTLYNRGQTEADIPEGYDTIIGNRKDYAAFEAQMAEAGNFDAVIDGTPLTSPSIYANQRYEGSPYGIPRGPTRVIRGL